MRYACKGASVMSHFLCPLFLKTLLKAQVDVDAMREDTGLEYSAANEMLWRHCRRLQVSLQVFNGWSEPEYNLDCKPEVLGVT